MALNPLKLSLMVGADGASWYRYASSADTLANMAAANYFNAVQNILNPGDVIIANDSANMNNIFFVKTSVAATGVVTVVAFGTAALEADAPAAAPENGRKAHK